MIANRPLGNGTRTVYISFLNMGQIKLSFAYIKQKRSKIYTLTSEKSYKSVRVGEKKN